MPPARRRRHEIRRRVRRPQDGYTPGNRGVVLKASFDDDLRPYIGVEGRPSGQKGALLPMPHDNSRRITVRRNTAVKTD